VNCAYQAAAPGDRNFCRSPATAINRNHTNPTRPYQSMRRQVLALAGIAAVAVPATTAFASAPASHPTVVCDYWHGSHYGHAFGAVKPSWLGEKGRAPIERIHWTSWGRNSAAGHGEIVHMGTFKVTIRLHDAKSHDGVRRFTALTGTGQIHWSQSWTTDCR
jgi:hypothetical protein